jgi:HD-GYP domain-containing protein (c-di-GMP phosphodiesterase class II)
VPRWHHERFDGSGYSDGLAGEKILLHARMVAVADALDAMCSDRVYRGSLPATIVRGELLAGRGSQFDPACVDAFLRVVDAGQLEQARRSRGGGVEVGAAWWWPSAGSHAAVAGRIDAT